ncbi:ATP-binding cassette domain-containing protein [Vibrio sp. 2026]|uniref:ATP-binding cassette domain-containing protein n=1 Tax=Vibrio alginolyticus TaxID=663 RepID=A0A7Y4AZX5_VIBAL|nr:MULTISPECIES: ATP-binding cassette domain-containing protein [Vibrio]MDG2625844.1 ATP-binding cassette domain-containing protein [Vibrio parahaemolyticus]EGQ9097807.1 ATP-binding cassette domain-containing protein [Vibrio alginolyticus]EIJ2377457.1 ATP-binding cassette domain-containing protein [Vibrio alginolyticus]EKA3118106.1 ATP-binding cassette domain-containing protein [Vibrio alginolyticus]KLI73477.1 ABC transporter [Vibrio alginolyticus]
MTAHNTLYSNSTIPQSAKHRLYRVAIGWGLVALFEATAYTFLAISIVEQAPPMNVIIAAVLTVIVTVIVTRSGFLSGAKLAGDLYSSVGHSLSKAKLAWFNDQHRTQLTQLAERGIPGFMAIPAHQLQTFLHAPMLPIFLVIGIGVVGGGEIALLSAVLLLVAVLVQYKAQRYLSRSDSDRHDAELQATKSTLELIDHLELLRSTAGPERSIERIEQSWHAQEEAHSTINRNASIATLVSGLATILPLAGIAIYLVLEPITQPLLVLALLILITRAAAPLGELALAGFAINDVKSSIKNYAQLTNVPVLPEPNPQFATSPKNHKFELNLVGHLDLFEDASTEIKQGDTVVINGVSGSGKSTLLGLFLRFDDPDQGLISLGGIDLKNIPYDVLTQHIAYVAQDPVIYTGTLADNIRLGNPNASDYEVESFARHAQLDELIDSSPKRIHQTVGQRGSGLSGGERQRVAIARALIKKAPILIFDEATAALDEATEKSIAQHIQTLNSTVIIVTHSDQNIWSPTLELTIENGRVKVKKNCATSLTSKDTSAYQGLSIAIDT